MTTWISLVNVCWPVCQVFTALELCWTWKSITFWWSCYNPKCTFFNDSLKINWYESVNSCYTAKHCSNSQPNVFKDTKCMATIWEYLLNVQDIYFMKFIWWTDGIKNARFNIAISVNVKLFKWRAGTRWYTINIQSRHVTSWIHHWKVFILEKNWEDEEKMSGCDNLRNWFHFHLKFESFECWAAFKKARKACM